MPRGEVKHTQGAHYPNPERPGRDNTCAVIHKQQIGAYRLGQRDSGALAFAKLRQRQARLGRRHPRFQPSGMRRKPGVHRRGRAWVMQLDLHHRRQQHGGEQAWQHLNGVDQNQILQRAGISDDDLHPPSQPEVARRALVFGEIRKRVGFVDIMRFEEAVEFVQHLEPEGSA